MSQQKTQPRIWTIAFEEDFDAFRDEVRRAMLEIESIGARLGGKFYIEPKREQGEDSLWYTTEWVIAWDSFVPGRRKAPAQAEAAQPEDDEEAEVVPLPVAEDTPVAA